MENSYSQDKTLQEQEHPSKKTKPPQKGRSTWFRILSTILLVGIVLGSYGFFFAPDMAEVVKGQLSKLRENRITQAYYDYTSKAFQTNTSLENFRNFIALYKVLSDNKSFIFEDSERNEGIGKITGVLISNDLQEMEVEYLLAKENDRWKIQSIRLKELKVGSETDSVMQELVKLVHEQLMYLQKDDIVDAYYTFFSKEFQSETPLQVFQEFVNTHPILTSYKNIDFKDKRIEDSTGFITLLLGSEQGNFKAEYKLKRENGEWKIWNLRLTLPPEAAAKKALTDPNTLSDPVREWLDDLLMDKVEHAYERTSKEFKEATSLNSFENFVHTYPVLLRRDLTDMRTGAIDDGVGKLRVHLHDEEGITTIEFKLGYDEGVWRIWGIQVVEAPEENESYAEEPLNPTIKSLAEQLIGIVHQQLKSLMHQDYTYAYYHFASQEYRDHHTLENFEQFLEANPLFTHGRDAQFDKMEQKRNKIALKGMLETYDYEVTPVRYEFVKDDGKWKISHFEALNVPHPITENEIELFEAKENEPNIPTNKIEKITIGDDVDSNGMIKTPRVVMDQGTNLLFFNVQIDNGVADSLITLFLNHVDSGTTAPPLATKLKHDGDTTVSFSYAAPPKGWPEGNYVVKITINTGDEKVQGFQLRKGEKKFYLDENQ